MKPNIFGYDFYEGGTGYIDLNKVVAVAVNRYNSRNFLVYIGDVSKDSRLEVPISYSKALIKQWKQE